MNELFPTNNVIPLPFLEIIIAAQGIRYAEQPHKLGHALIFKNILLLVRREQFFDFGQGARLSEQVLKELWPPPAGLPMLLGVFIEVIGAGIVIVNQSSIAIKKIVENIVVMDCKMKNVGGNGLGYFAGDLLVWTGILGENAYPPINRRTDQEFAVGTLRNLFNRRSDGLTVFRSDLD
ncbi:MAG TPA: hypothetical protein VN048_05685 [Verrucomicrobiae bacterium]|nr:hypothetical protein [Verrucomicrobiae bacterium]